MRQRNDGDQPLAVHTDPPQVVAPGGTVDHDSYIVGLTVVPEEPAAGTAKTKATDKTTGTAAGKSTERAEATTDAEGEK